VSKIDFDQRWIAKYTSVPGNLPWWEKLEGEDRKNAEAWILQRVPVVQPKAMCEKLGVCQSKIAPSCRAGVCRLAVPVKVDHAS